jgi:hypothetical protein
MSIKFNDSVKLKAKPGTDTRHKYQVSSIKYQDTSIKYQDSRIFGYSDSQIFRQSENLRIRESGTRDREPQTGDGRVSFWYGIFSRRSSPLRSEIVLDDQMFPDILCFEILL